jgi:toxin YoeB
MRIVWASDAWDDYLYWQSADPKVIRLINDLINDTRRSPFRGLGKPEPLKYDLKGWWSRRITSDHRLVYRVSGSSSLQQLEILQCRYHYR